MKKLLRDKISLEIVFNKNLPIEAVLDGVKESILEHTKRLTDKNIIQVQTGVNGEIIDYYIKHDPIH